MILNLKKENSTLRNNLDQARAKCTAVEGMFLLLFSDNSRIE